MPSGARATHRLLFGEWLVDGGDDLSERLLFFAPFGEPDVLVGHLATCALVERLLAAVDELGEEFELLLVFGQVGRSVANLSQVKHALPRSQTCLGREQAPAVGEDPVGSLSSSSSW